MISASSATQAYFNSNIREENTQEIKITITKSGKTYTVTDDDLVASSVKITRKSVSGASFDIGECYIDTLSFTINKDISNYKNLTGAKIVVKLTVTPDSEHSETLKLGTFRVPEDGIKRTNTLLQVTGESYIGKFEKSRKKATFEGDLYALVSEACTKCKVTFGMSESEFRGLSANTSKTYKLKKDSSLESYRDAIMYVAQLIGGFATTDVEGKLLFKNYRSSNDTVRVNDNVIINYSIGDDVYNLSGLGMSVGDSDVYLYREGEDDDSPYFLNLDTNPLLENCEDSDITSIVSNIWAKLIDLDLNNFSFNFNGNPLIEVGDIISIPERNLSTYVASYEWVYHGKEKLECVSVDKTKRTKKQTEKQNKNKKSDSSEDSRVDDLIKNTTTKKKKVKKTHTETYTISLSVLGGHYLVSPSKLPKYRWIAGGEEEVGEGAQNLEFNVVLYSPILDIEQFFYYNVINKLVTTPADNDIITVDLSNVINYIVIGYNSHNYVDIDTSASLSFKPRTDKDYTANNNINASSTVSKIYKLDALYNAMDTIPSLTFSNTSTLTDNTSNVTQYIAKSNLALNLKLNIDTLNSLYTYESFENGILKVKYKDLLNYDTITENINTNNVVTASFNGYDRSLRYLLNKLESDNLRTFTTGTAQTLSSAIATTKSDVETEIATLQTKEGSITVSYDTYEEESYTVTIEGTGDKINDTADKAEENTSEIEKLKNLTSNLKTSVKTNTAKIKDLLSRVSVHDNIISAAREDTAKLDVRVTKLENSGGGDSSTVDTETKEQVATNKQNIETLQTDVNSLKSKVSTLENSGSGGGSTVDTETKQQVATNKSNIEALQLTVNQHTTSIEDIIKRLTALEAGGGGGETEALKFLNFALNFNEAASNKNYYYPSFKLENYLIDGTYYITEGSGSNMLFNLIATLNKTGSTQTFRRRKGNTSTDYTVIDGNTADLQSSNITLTSANNDFYFDCVSKLDDLAALSKDINVKVYNWVRATGDVNWLNETTKAKVTTGAHDGDIINLKTTFTGGFKAYSLSSKPEALNKYYYKIVFGSGSSTTHYDTNAIVVQDWTAIDAEPGVLTDIKFTFKTAYGGKTVLLYVSDGQYVRFSDYDRIPLLT